GPLDSAAIEADRRRFHAQKLPDQAGQRGHRTTRAATSDCREGFALLRAGPLVCNDTQGPVAFSHRLGGPSNDDEPEAVERDCAVTSAFDLEGDRKRAGSFARADRQLSWYARTNEVATACFVVLPTNLPCRRCHRSNSFTDLF